MPKTKHGLCNASIYGIYYAMRHRCNNPSDPNYRNYGARGIKVCDAWATNFIQFFADMGHCPPNHTLERIDNTLGYSPNNCRWATRREQANNTRSNKLYTYNGKTKCISAWAREYSIPSSTLQHRLQRMPFEDAIDTHRYRMPNSKKYNHLGKNLTLKEWCKELNLKYCTVWYRINKANYSFSDAIKGLPNGPPY